MTDYEKEREAKWQALSDRIGGELGDETAAAFKELYTIYDDRLIAWYAGLYDPKIGGYYYSNSARDFDTVEYKGKTYKLLPDAESTFHSIGWWRGAGINGGITEWGKWIPEWMQKQVGDFIYSLQDEDGYFYHPQWGKDVGISRIARDSMWCRHILGSYGIRMKYKTLEDAVKGVRSEKTLIPEHLSSEKKFAEYLEKLNIGERSYHSGNELAAQVGQITATGRIMQCVEYLNKMQNENGHWHSKTNYYAVNGLFKLSFIYGAAGVRFPRILEAARAAIDAITSDEPMSAVTDLYNTWYTAANLTDILRKKGGEEGNRQADEIVSELRRLAPYAIKRSKEKILPFKKADGAFSYGPKTCSCTSQGAPVAHDLPEGDENATVIATSGLVGNIFNALELTDCKVNIFGDRERQMYLELLEEKHK